MKFFTKAIEIVKKEAMNILKRMSEQPHGIAGASTHFSREYMKQQEMDRKQDQTQQPAKIIEEECNNSFRKTN
jgi:hypothetical protein